MGYYRRVAPPLPDPDTLPFPGNIIRRCSDCDLRQGCLAPVSGDGIAPAEVMFLGQNPGREEDQWGKPFVGQSGRQLDSLLMQCGLNREGVFVTNVVHCLTRNNAPPKPASVRACRKWLDIELGLVRPQIIVAMGAFAIRAMLGDGADSVEHLHGRPIEKDGRIILPCYHPAAGLHDTSTLRFLYDDFQVLRGLLHGKTVADYTIQDEYPNPDYRVADTEAKLKQMRDEIHDSGEFAVDTEQCRGELWSAQISSRPGSAWFIPIKTGYKGRVDLKQYRDSLAIVHYYLHDIEYIDIDERNFRDTMVMSYQTGQPQGLKELASRLCGIRMINYSEMVRPGQQKLAIEYLRKAAAGEWPDPPTIEETKWDNKAGKIVTKVKKPWHISRKVNKALDDFEEDSALDLWGRWQGIPQEERQVVEVKLGLMPESSLADIRFEDAVRYACRDADSTLRVYHKLKQLISDLELDYVLEIDTATLPLADSVMRNGMAVNVDYLRGLSQDYDCRMRAKATELSALVGHPFNPNSSPQVASVVYQELGFQPTRTTPSGEVSTDDQELKKTGHPVAKGIIQYRNLLKLKSTYADNLIRSARPDEQGIPRVHTVIKTTRVETGRWSSSKSDDGTGANLQNIPTRNKEAKMIKSGFEAPPGKLILEGDLGQVEVRTQAHLAKCKGLIDLFNRGGDPHTETASRLFGIPLDEAKKDKYRYPCKRAGFGIIYMIGGQGLSSQINEYIADLEMDGEPVDIEPWDVPTCEKFIADYYKLYPEIRDYQQEQLAYARRHGFVRDICGRIRYIPEVFCAIPAIQEAGARQAANMPVTSSAQFIIKAAMMRIWQEMPATGYTHHARVVMQIHDSLVSEVDENEDVWRPFSVWMHSIMCNTVRLLVPVEADFKIGKDWGHLEKVKLKT